MEITIKIILTFIVVFAVGVIIIQISSDLLNTSKDNLEGLGDRNSEDKMIEKNSFSKTEIELLSKQCFENNYGVKRIDDVELCYILKSNINSIDVVSMNLDTNNFISSATGNSKTIYIKFDMINNITIND